MRKTKRSTVYLDPSLHRALRVKAAAPETSVSKLEAVLKDLKRPS
jgi:hypothetical protein